MHFAFCRSGLLHKELGHQLQHEWLWKSPPQLDLPAGTPVSPGQEFRYVWHCHVLEHEDNEMMRPYNVIG
jgi:hypothetical protein